MYCPVGDVDISGMEIDGRDVSLRASSLSSECCSWSGCDWRVLYVAEEGREECDSDWRFWLAMAFFFAPDSRRLPSYFLREGLVMCHFFNRLRSWDSLGELAGILENGRNGRTWDGNRWSGRA
jgi:hypothetical protein